MNKLYIVEVQKTDTDNWQIITKSVKETYARTIAWVFVNKMGYSSARIKELKQ